MDSFGFPSKPFNNIGVQKKKSKPTGQPHFHSAPPPRRRQPPTAPRSGACAPPTRRWTWRLQGARCMRRAPEPSCWRLNCGECGDSGGGTWGWCGVPAPTLLGVGVDAFGGWGWLKEKPDGQSLLGRLKEKLDGNHYRASFPSLFQPSFVFVAGNQQTKPGETGC